MPAITSNLRLFIWILVGIATISLAVLGYGLHPNLWYMVNRVVPAERRKGGRRPGPKSPLIWALFSIAALVFVIGTAVGIMATEVQPDEPKQSESFAAIPSASPIEAIEATSLLPSPTLQLPTLTAAIETPQEHQEPYYLEYSFGCMPGAQWHHEKNLCPGAQLEILTELQGASLQVCKQGADFGLCPEGLPLSELTQDLEWRFLVLNSSTGPIRVRPTVIVGNQFEGELARSDCRLGRNAEGIPYKEEDVSKWLSLDAGLKLSVYCPVTKAESIEEWAVAVVDYDVEGTRYYVSKQYTP